MKISYLILFLIITSTLFLSDYKPKNIDTPIRHHDASSSAFTIKVDDESSKVVKERFRPIGEEGKVIEVPLAKVSVSKGVATVDVPKRKYFVDQTITENIDRSLSVKTDISIKVYDKVYKIPTTSMIKNVIPSREFRFNPLLFLGVGGGIDNNLNPDIYVGPSFSFFSYGRYVNSPEWSILNIGLNYSLERRDVAITLSPVLVNVNPLLPFLKSTYVSMDLYYNVISQSYGAGVGLKVSL